MTDEIRSGNKTNVNIIAFLYGVTVSIFSSFLRKQGVPNFPPIHPGQFLGDYVLKNKNISKQELINKVPGYESKLAAIFNGQESFDANMRDILRPHLGNVVDIIYNNQSAYDFFQRNGKYPSRTG